MFSVKNGVRQDGVFSGRLFNLYINELILKTDDIGLRCIYLHDIFVVCVLFADDILLLSGSLIKLQLVLNLCFDFGYENDLVYNAKSQCILSLVNCPKMLAELKCFFEKVK